MLVSSGARARAIAGLVCAALLAAASATTDADLAAPPGANETVAVNALGLPEALDEDGNVIPASVGQPPEIKVDAPSEQILDRARATNKGSVTEAAVKPLPGRPEPAGPEIDPETLLVTFRPGTSDADAEAALQAADVTGSRLAATDTYEIAVGDHGQAELTESLKASEAVAAVDQNMVRSVAKTPNDQQTATQLQYLGGLGLPAAWDVANPGAGVTVAVIDSGVDLDHPDLAPNLVPGYDFVNNDSNPQDDFGHGTQVAGVIGAATNNGAGVAGIAWNAKIMPLKVLDANGTGYDDDVVEAIRWAVDHGAKVINMSLGGPGGSAAIDAAVEYALGYNPDGTYSPQRGAVLVAAAGNDGAPYVDYPAAAPGVIAVSATDHTGQFAWFSNHSPRVDLAAPGIDIRSTALATGPAAAVADGTGTSFSSPIVAGVAALVRERHPGWTWDLVYNELLRTATDKGPAGADSAYGFGLVNAAAAASAGAIAPVSQPSLAGDAGNLPSSARAIATGTSITETLAYEGDEDWFSFEVPAGAGVTVTVTPPAAQTEDIRAKEMDPVVEVYGPGGGLAGTADATLTGEPETLTFNAGAGRSTIHVTSYLGAAAPAAYTVGVTLGATLPNTAWAPWQVVYDSEATGEAVAVADFTGDGRDDVVTTTGYDFGGPDEFKLVLSTQQPDGTLAAPVKLNTHMTYCCGSDLAAGDIDGDGDPDVILGTEQGLDIAWTGPSGLAEPVLYAVGSATPYLADMDGADPIDIVDGDRVLRWNGDGFDESALPVVASSAGDLTGDGRTDIVQAGWDGGPTVSVYAQQADGSWSGPTQLPFPSGITYSDMEIGDISGDGRADLVVTAGGHNGLLSYLQQADGTMAAPTTMPTIVNSQDLALADVTGDDRTDVIVGHQGYMHIGVFRQTPAGALAPEEALPFPYYQGTTRSSIASGDLDGDGYGDIAVADHNADLVVIRHQAPSTPETTKPAFSSVNPAPHATGVATSVKPTVTFGRPIYESSVSYGPYYDDTVLLQDGRNGFWVEATASVSGSTLTVSPTAPLTPGVPYTLYIFGVMDLAENPMYGRFTFTTAAGGVPNYKLNADYHPFPVDLDANGYDDVVWYTPSTAADPFWLHGPDGKVDGGTFNLQGTLRPVAGDFDGNGYEDIFWYAPGTAVDVLWYLGLASDGTIQITPKNFTINATFVPVAGDFDGNGYEDIFWHGPGTTGDSVWYFKAGATYTTKSVAQVTGTNNRLAAGDFDRNGYDDVVWHVPGTGAESLWKGGPTGFTTSAVAGKLNATYSLRAGDYNGDGFDDVYIYASGASSLWKGGAAFTSQAAPVIAGTARPVSGELTGDLRDDLLAYVPGTTADTFFPGKPSGL